jgi:type II secretory pathway pseudopilin PulG
VKTIYDNSKEKSGFTIVELLTVMSIIILLISLLVPALNRVRRYAQSVKQRAQFHSIAVALDLFNAENEGYPDSNAFDDQGLPYCGAMKLAEAMVGQDLKGFNPKSRFRREGYPNRNPPPARWDGMPYPPYNTIGITVDPVGYTENIKSRKMYLQLENANAFQLLNIYDTASADFTSRRFDPNTFVLCDIYTRATNRATGKKVGMPILYYKADPTNTAHLANANPTILDNNIYDVRDNQDLIDLVLPWNLTFNHPMARAGLTSNGASILNWPTLFYDLTRNPKIPGGDRPYREDSYILLSAGFDGEYGTSDDIFNFGE